MSEVIMDGEYYRHFLTSAAFPYTDDEQSCIKNTVSKMLDTPTYGSRPGMLLGKIQSGKTKTFMAIIGLGFDNGYDVSIVLTKGTKALSKQTHIRIQNDFGRFVEHDDVLVFDIMNMPQQLTGYELKKKLIIVVKKQKQNLEKLLALYSDHDYGLYDKKSLLIDDEADFASIGYRRSEGEIDANLTAKKLDELRNKAKDASFLQVTATPYSLYLQPEDVEIKGEAFKPVRPAFTELVPVNDAYIGSDYYFNDADDLNSVASKLYIPLTHNELLVLKKKDGRKLNVDDVLTSNAIEGLRGSFISFIVGGVIRQNQAIKSGDNFKKFSFLIHTEVAKAAHGWQKEIVDNILLKLNDEAKKRTGLFKKLIRQGYEELETSINQSGYYLPDYQNVEDRIAVALNDGEVLITSVNSEKKVEELLDDTGQLKLRTPLNIFIGGQILDRGITIGNLIGFYYGRRPNRFQQDTVLQHSRMYGFRPKEDLTVTRFYTEPTIYNAMRRMHESDIALREEISKNPNQEVIFIQGTDDGVVVPCSPNKILLSETTTLRPHRRLLPVGFQTDYKSYTRPVTERIDKLLSEVNPDGASTTPFKIPTKLAHQIIDESQQAIKMSEEEGYTFDWRGLHSAIDYLSGRSPNSDEIWCLWLTNRNNARLAGSGSHTKYVATPDTATSEGATAREYATDTPMLMLFRQNGSEEKGWMGSPFYWPLLVAPGNTRTAIYANETAD